MEDMELVGGKGIVALIATLMLIVKALQILLYVKMDNVLLRLAGRQLTNRTSTSKQ
jgi:hypothetical protein